MSESEKRVPPNKGTARLWTVVALGLLACFASLAYAVCSDNVLQGGRGGVVALMLTFGMLFLDRRTEVDYLQLDLTPKDNDDIKRLTALNAQTRNALASMIDWNDKHKLPLAVLSIVGTACAGFGDLAAAGLRKLLF